MPIKKEFFPDAGLLLVLSLAVIFLFVNLGDTDFWQDEAETAILARSVLRDGIPKAWDGENLLSSLNGADFNEDFVWTWHPWAQAYLAAISFSFLGESNFSGRFPFALAGLLTVFFLYLLGLKATGSRKIAILSSLLLTISLQFVLYSRQCRYYSLLALFTVLILYSFYKLPGKSGAILFVFSSVFLFHSNFLPFFPALFSFFIFLVIFERDREKIKSFFFCAAVTVFLTLPWLAYAKGLFHLKGFSDAVGLLGKGGGASFLEQEFDFLKIVNETVFPLILVLVAVILLLRAKTKHKKLYQLLLILTITNLLFLPYITYAQNIVGMRYSVGLIPVFCLLASMIIAELIDYKRWVGSLVFLIIISTNIINSFPVFILKSFKGDFIQNKRELNAELEKMFLWKGNYFDFLYELTHHYKGPVNGIVKFLKKYGKKGEMVLTNYESAAILFYTDLNLAYVISNNPEFYNLIPSGRYDSVLEKKLPSYVYTMEKIDWIIPRSNYKDRLFKPERVLRKMEEKGYRIKKYELDYPDLPWSNRADIRYHKFRTVRDYQKVVVYRVVQDKAEVQNPNDK